MTIEVELDGRRFLCDPGFGLSITGPIALEDGATRTESHGEFTIQRRDDDGCPSWELFRGAKLAHIVDDLPVQPIDVRTGHLITSTDRHFPVHPALRPHAVRRARSPDGDRKHGHHPNPWAGNGAPEISASEAVQLTREAGLRLEDYEARNLQDVLVKLRRGA